jgi:hypothetical protein
LEQRQAKFLSPPLGRRLSPEQPEKQAISLPPPAGLAFPNYGLMRDKGPLL